MSITKRSLVFAKDCNYKSWQLLLLCCPYCLQPVYLRNGNYNVAHFAHYDSGSKGLKYVYCPIRNNTGNPRYTDVESGIHRQQTLLEYFGYFSYHFDEFIGYDNTEAVKIDYEVLKRLRMLMNKEFGDREFVKRIVSENMRKFLNNTLSRFIEKKSLSSEVILTLLNDVLYRDLLRDKLLHKYLVCVSKFLKYFYTHYGKWDFSEEKKLCIHLVKEEKEILEAYNNIITRNKLSKKINLNKPIKNEQNQNIVNCSLCGIKIQENKLKNHLNYFCPKNPFRESLKKSNDKILCPYCLVFVKKTRFYTHISNKCPKRK